MSVFLLKLIARTFAMVVETVCLSGIGATFSGTVAGWASLKRNCGRTKRAAGKTVDAVFATGQILQQIEDNVDSMEMDEVLRCSHYCSKVRIRLHPESASHGHCWWLQKMFNQAPARLENIADDLSGLSRDHGLHERLPDTRTVVELDNVFSDLESGRFSCIEDLVQHAGDLHVKLHARSQRCAANSLNQRTFMTLVSKLVSKFQSWVLLLPAWTNQFRCS